MTSQGQLLNAEGQADLAAVLGRVPSGLFIVTAHDGSGQETGMLASWVQQASFDPPAVTFAVQTKRYLNDWLSKSPQIAICLIGESQRRLLSHFGKGFEPGEPAFEGLSIERTSDGLPVLMDCIGWIAGEVIGQIEAGDHVLYVLQLTEACRGPRLDDEEPWVHIRRNGLGY